MRGSVTAEFAVTLPALTMVLALLLFAGSAGILQLRLEDAARAGARAAARGDGSAQVVELVARLAGEGAAAAVTVDGEFVTVTVSGQLRGPLASVAPWRQSARAVARIEMGRAPVLGRFAPGPGAGQAARGYP